VFVLVLAVPALLVVLLGYTVGYGLWSWLVGSAGAEPAGWVPRQSVDGLVLPGGCDTTIPSLLMAAASVDLPAVVVPGGPMLTGTFRGVRLGCFPGPPGPR
jgi:hypothetical protein